MAEVKITNDGKKKHQSFEASITFGGEVTPAGAGYTVTIEGYGADEMEARLDLNMQLRMLEKQIERARTLNLISAGL